MSPKFSEIKNEIRICSYCNISTEGWMALDFGDESNPVRVICVDCLIKTFDTVLGKPKL